jgi:hypothetical protein
MPLKESDIKKYSIQIAESNELFVWVGPCSVKKIEAQFIPLDGRKYECGGTIFLANGLELQASFRIQKSEHALLLDDTVYTKVDDVWYKLGEPSFYVKTGLEEIDFFPFDWLPDIPLEGNKIKPFAMDFKG